MSDLIDLLTEMHETTAYRELPLSIDRLSRFIESVKSSGQFLYHKPGVVMIGTVSKAFFSESLVASDVLLYVSPDNRGRGEAEKALSEFVSWAESKGASQVVIGQTTGVNGEEFDRLAKKLNFSFAGKVYRR